ncbi:MAG: N-acetylmuramoyl-L-alanine amidase [Deltaproteobacteria bacterium]|nr:N-acetylmuramoyl-L-alanine amidase [Deltaproteobacteria bacterium]
MKKIFIDIGHGGKEPGALAVDGTEEKWINLKVGKYLIPFLRQFFEVKASRETDKYLSLRERADMANEWGADVFISIHHNASLSQAKGAELIHTIWTDKSQGDEIAEMIAEEFKAIGQNIRRIFSKENSTGEDWYGVVRYTKMPAIITEFAFIDNPEDYKKIDEPADCEAEAKAIYKALCKYYDIKIPLTDWELEYKNLLKNLKELISYAEQA